MLTNVKILWIEYMQFSAERRRKSMINLTHTLMKCMVKQATKSE